MGNRAARHAHQWPLAPYRVLPDLTPGMRVGRISRASVADFLLRQAQEPTLLGRSPALTS